MKKNVLALVLLASFLILGVTHAQGFGEYASENQCACMYYNISLNSTQLQHWVLMNSFNYSLSFFVVTPNFGSNAPQLSFSTLNGTIPPKSEFVINVTVHLPIRASVTLASANTTNITVTGNSIGVSNTTIISAYPFLQNTSSGIRRYEQFSVATPSGGIPPYTFNFRLYDPKTNYTILNRSGSNNTVQWEVPSNVTETVKASVNITYVSNTPIYHTWTGFATAYAITPPSSSGGVAINLGTAKRIEVYSNPSTTTTTTIPSTIPYRQTGAQTSPGETSNSSAHSGASPSASAYITIGIAVVLVIIILASVAYMVNTRRKRNREPARKNKVGAKRKRGRRSNGKKTRRRRRRA